MLLFHFRQHHGDFKWWQRSFWVSSNRQFRPLIQETLIEQNRTMWQQLSDTLNPLFELLSEALVFIDLIELHFVRVKFDFFRFFAIQIIEVSVFGIYVAFIVWGNKVGWFRFF